MSATTLAASGAGVSAGLDGEETSPPKDTQETRGGSPHPTLDPSKARRQAKEPKAGGRRRNKAGARQGPAQGQALLAAPSAAADIFGTELACIDV